MADGSIIIDTKLDNSGLENGFSKIGNIAGKACKGVAVAIGTVTTAFAGLVTASINARGELEQQIGGVQTLFANELGDASETVIKNANNAYKSAGMSAVEYMSTATSFSASLLQSLGKDTAKAAEVADMAIIDMSDNANKMGTDMALIQNAYQGFAKQNYTMLDNLKLGYGGTKTEMERLLADATKLTGIKYDINNLSDVYNAIHVIQGELGITGTTAKEAAETLQGSMASLKASWSNFLSSSGNLSQVAESLKDVVKNIVRIVNDAIPDIMSSISSALPELLELGGEIIGQIIDGIIKYLPQLMESAGQILQKLTEGIISYLPKILETGIQIITQLINGIAEMLPELIPMAIDAIISFVTGLLDNIDKIIDAGIELILGLIDGIIAAIPKLIEKIPEIIGKIISAIITNVPKILDAIMTILQKLPGLIWNLLISIVTSLINWIADLNEKVQTGISNVVTSIINWFKELPRQYMESLSRSYYKYSKMDITNKAKSRNRNIKYYK